MAPAIASNFPDTYLNINGWLRSLGVEAVFDVSFGAELTVKSYLEHIKANKQTLHQVRRAAMQAVQAPGAVEVS